MRPTASDVTAAPSADLVRIVIRAAELGYSVARVATALRISPAQLDAITRRVDCPGRVQELDVASAGGGEGG